MRFGKTRGSGGLLAIYSDDFADLLQEATGKSRKMTDVMWGILDYRQKFDNDPKKPLISDVRPEEEIESKHKGRTRHPCWISLHAIEDEKFWPRALKQLVPEDQGEVSASRVQVRDKILKDIGDARKAQLKAAKIDVQEDIRPATAPQAEVIEPMIEATAEPAPEPKHKAKDNAQAGAIELFKFKGSDVRVVMIDDEPQWVGPDICRRLGHTNESQAYKRHCRGVTKEYPIADRLGRIQPTRILTESDVFRLIGGSTLPEAEEFKTWIYEDVIPSIRKTGSYTAPGTRPSNDMTTLFNGFADMMREMREANRESQREHRELILAMMERQQSPPVAQPHIDNVVTQFPVRKRQPGEVSPTDFLNDHARHTGLRLSLKTFRRKLDNRSYIHQDTATGNWLATTLGEQSQLLINVAYGLVQSGRVDWSFRLTALGVQEFSRLIREERWSNDDDDGEQSDLGF